jgi:hypothetical protein
VGSLAWAWGGLADGNLDPQKGEKGQDEWRGQVSILRLPAYEATTRRTGVPRRCSRIGCGYQSRGIGALPLSYPASWDQLKRRDEVRERLEKKEEGRRRRRRGGKGRKVEEGGHRPALLVPSQRLERYLNLSTGLKWNGCRMPAALSDVPAVHPGPFLGLAWAHEVPSPSFCRPADSRAHESFFVLFCRLNRGYSGLGSAEGLAGIVGGGAP